MTVIIKPSAQNELIIDLYCRFKKELCVYATRYCSRLMAEDIVHQAFINSYDKISAQLSLPQQKSYLYTTVRNLCLNQRRNSSFVCAEETHQLVTEMVVADSHDYLYKIIGQLPKREREIILLSLQGYSSKEIAEHLSIEYTTVKHYKKEAYAKIRVVLDGESAELLED